MTTTYCYDYADRLLSSTNAKVTAAVYDAHGNTTSLGSGTGNVTTFGYDSSDRNNSITEGTKSVTYARDVQGRITSRTLVNGTTTTNKYGFTASGDTPDLLLSSTSTIVEKYIQLPGNVLLTLRPTQTGAAAKVFSLPNIHGDVMVTTDANGASSGTFTYDPFGNKVSASLPNNTATSSTYGWVGQHEKDTEIAFALAPTQMGARVYIASIGRFLQVDPVQGGTPNNYVYPPDSVNDFDLTGTKKTQRGKQANVGRELSENQKKLIFQYGLKGRGPADQKLRKEWKAGKANLKSREKDLRVPTEKARASRASKDIPKASKILKEGGSKADVMLWFVDTFGPWRYMNLPNVQGESTKA